MPARFRLTRALFSILALLLASCIPAAEAPTSTPSTPPTITPVVPLPTATATALPPTATATSGAESTATLAPTATSSGTPTTAPGHYEFETPPYGNVRVELKAGDLKVAPIYAPYADQRPVLDLAVPPTCN